MVAIRPPFIRKITVCKKCVKQTWKQESGWVGAHCISCDDDPEKVKVRLMAVIDKFIAAKAAEAAKAEAIQKAAEAKATEAAKVEAANVEAAKAEAAKAEAIQKAAEAKATEAANVEAANVEAAKAEAIRKAAEAKAAEAKVKKASAEPEGWFSGWSDGAGATTSAGEENDSITRRRKEREARRQKREEELTKLAGASDSDKVKKEPTHDCHQCGAANPIDTVFCKKCGIRKSRNPEEAQTSSTDESSSERQRKEREAKHKAMVDAEAAKVEAAKVEAAKVEAAKVEVAKAAANAEVVYDDFPKRLGYSSDEGESDEGVPLRLARSSDEGESDEGELFGLIQSAKALQQEAKTDSLFQSANPPVSQPKTAGPNMGHEVVLRESLTKLQDQIRQTLATLVEDRMIADPQFVGLVWVESEESYLFGWYKKEEENPHALTSEGLQVTPPEHGTQFRVDDKSMRMLIESADMKRLRHYLKRCYDAFNGWILLMPAKMIPRDE
jgi:hypothetical protein